MSRPRPSSRDAILRVFAELVAERGYSETSLDDVAATLGVSKGAVLYHFRTKDNLLSEVHAAYFERRFAEVDHINAVLDDPVTKLAALIFALLAAHRDDRAASLTFLREFVRYVESGLNQQILERRLAYRDTVVSVIEDGVARGDFTTENPSMSALHIFGMCNYAWTWYVPDSKLSVEEIARLFVIDIVGGLGATQMLRRALDTVIDQAIETVLSAPGRLPPAAEAREFPQRQTGQLPRSGAGRNAR